MKRTATLLLLVLPALCLHIVSGSASIKAGNYFVTAPEPGIAPGGFRLSAMYHMVGGGIPWVQ